MGGDIVTVETDEELFIALNELKGIVTISRGCWKIRIRSFGIGERRLSAVGSRDLS